MLKLFGGQSLCCSYAISNVSSTPSFHTNKRFITLLKSNEKQVLKLVSLQIMTFRILIPLHLCCECGNSKYMFEIVLHILVANKTDNGI